MRFRYGVIPVDRDAALRKTLRRSGLSLCALIAALWATSTLAADTATRYQQERAACHSRSDEDRAACLREAVAARQAERRGQLGDSTATYEQNALVRCNALPVEHRDSCERRMRGEGMATGSVEEGGIYRELRQVELPPVARPDGGAK